MEGRERGGFLRPCSHSGANDSGDREKDEEEVGENIEASDEGQW